MKKFTIHLLMTFFSVIMFLGIPAVVMPQPAAEAATFTATVDYVVDGDTVYLKKAVKGTIKVRLLSIDTPETYYYGEDQGHWAFDAKDYLINLLPPGTQITLETDVDEKDVYGRLLAHVFKGTLDVNKDMLLKGHAVTYYIWPNMKYFVEYQDAMQQGRQAGLGIWKPSNPLPELPFEFRLRVAGRTPDKYVGNYDTKIYVDPANYPDVPVENRVFFFTEQDAINAGYTRQGGSPPPAPVAGLFINELLPAPSSAYTTEWIEIYNANDFSVDLSGYQIDDLRNGGQSPYTIPSGIIIPAKGFYVWDTNAYFNNSGDEAYLIAPDGTVVDSFSYSTTQYDRSWYRYPDGGAWASQMDLTPTKGTSNN